MFSIRFLLVAALVFSQVVFAQVPVFYCSKDGKRTITDQPCENTGSVQVRKIEGRQEPSFKPDPVAEETIRSLVCPRLDEQKRSILDAQYYKGVPADAARLNNVDALLLKHGCSRKDVTRR